MANFARDLARYLVATIDEPPPGGEPLRDAAIELGAVFMGFGVFLANSAMREQQHPMNEGELVHALALFCLLQRMPAGAADEHLNPHLRKYLRLAERDLAQHETRFQALRATLAMEPAEQTLPARLR